MGNPFVGLVHPCKVYNILAVGAPLLYIGPELSHVTELLEPARGYPAISVRHGEAQRLAEAILHARAHGRAGEAVTAPNLAKPFAKNMLLPQLAAALIGSGGSVSPSDPG
jgi:hypothetical protein